MDWFATRNGFGVETERNDGFGTCENGSIIQTSRRIQTPRAIQMSIQVKIDI